jgi:hypothetical protein
MSVKHLSTQVSRPLKKGCKVGKTKRGNGTKIMAVADRNGLPVSVCAESATPHEVRLAMSTFLPCVPYWFHVATPFRRQNTLLG